MHTSALACAPCPARAWYTVHSWPHAESHVCISQDMTPSSTNFLLRRSSLDCSLLRRSLPLDAPPPTQLACPLASVTSVVIPRCVLPFSPLSFMLSAPPLSLPPKPSTVEARVPDLTPSAPPPPGKKYVWESNFFQSLSISFLASFRNPSTPFF